MTQVKEINRLSKREAIHYGNIEAKFIVRFSEPYVNKKDSKVVNGRYVSNKETGFLISNGNTGSWSALYSDLRMFDVDEREVGYSRFTQIK